MLRLLALSRMITVGSKVIYSEICGKVEINGLWRRWKPIVWLTHDREVYGSKPSSSVCSDYSDSAATSD